MNLSLSPEALQIINELIRKGQFKTPEAVIEAAIANMRDNYGELDEETLAAIRKADAQGERGEGMELEEFRAYMAKRYPGVR